MAYHLSDKEYLEVMSSILLGEPFKGHNSHDPAKIMEGVYLGSQRNAESWKILERLNISHVLNCAAYKGPRTYFGSPYEGLDIDYYEFPAEDTESYDITRHFPEAFRFIDKARQRGGNVLVHCALGINRSGAVCLAYLMDRARLPVLKATRIIKGKRRAFLSNPGFQKQLIRFARRRGLLDNQDDETFIEFSTRKNHKRRSHSFCFRTPFIMCSREETPTIDKLIAIDAVHPHNGSIRSYLPEVSIRPSSRRLASSLSRFDIY